MDAIAHMAFGDVLLLEAQELDPVTGTGLWPVEIADATSIRLATALGIVVVEAGANGSNNLDNYSNAAGHKIILVPSQAVLNELRGDQTFSNNLENGKVLTFNDQIPLAGCAERLRNAPVHAA